MVNYLVIQFCKVADSADLSNLIFGKNGNEVYLIDMGYFPYFFIELMNVSKFPAGVSIGTGSLIKTPPPPGASIFILFLM